MFGRDEDEQPPTDGEQFDVVGRFEDDGEPNDRDDADSLLAEPPDPTPSAENVHPRIRFHFWRLLMVFNLALLGISLGPVLVFLDGNRSLGVPLLVGGVVLFAYGIYRYRDAKAEIDAIVDEDGAGEDEANGEGESA